LALKAYLAEVHC